MYTKIFPVISLIILFAEVQSTNSEVDAHLEACFKNFNIAEDFLASVNFENLSMEDKKKLSCGMGCIYKELSKKDGLTMYQYFLNDLNTTRSWSKPIVDAKRQKLESCANVEDEECKFVKCLDLFSPPWNSEIEALKSLVIDFA